MTNTTDEDDEAPDERPLSVTLTVDDAGAGLRLDRWLAIRLEDMSRARLQSLIAAGAVALGGETIGEPNRRVKPGETYTVALPPAAEPGIVAENIELDVVYEDSDLIVIDKPAGLVVHPGAGHFGGTLVNALVARCGPSLSGIGGVMRPGIVHRLDKDTSGLLVVAKNDLAHKGLSDQFKSHGADGRLLRRYQALVWGVPKAEGAIDAPLARSTANRLKIAVTKGAPGRRAVTHYRLLRTFPGKSGDPEVSLLELDLETGRTHQIRVHLAHIGHPVLGDPLYGVGFKTRSNKLTEPARDVVDALERQALHAAELGFEHPRSRKHLTFKSDFPEEIQKVTSAFQETPQNPATKISALAQSGPGRKKQRKD